MLNQNTSAFLPTGATVAFSQFDINQFRAIAWFNVAAGLGFVILLLVIFRGESGCTEVPQLGLRFYNMCGSQRPKVTCSDVVVSLLTVFVVPIQKMASAIHIGKIFLQGRQPLVGLYYISHPLGLTY